MIRRIMVVVVLALFAIAVPGVASAKGGNGNGNGNGNGADVQMGDVSALDAAHTDIGGWVMIKRHNGETKVTVKLTDLTPGAQYHGHLHVGPCADLGGHYQDDPNGGDMPPNELHFHTFTATEDGTALVSSTAPWVAGSGAQSVFIHAGAPGGHGGHGGGGHNPKVACGEFSS